MRNLLTFILFAVLSTTSEPVLAWSLFEPRNYDDCILKNMKGVTSNDAALQIQVACMSKFPQEGNKRCKLREMTTTESSKVTGNASITRVTGPYFSGSFYNANDTATVEAITVIFTADNIKPPQEYDLFLSYPIAPRSSQDAGISVQRMPDKNFKWGIKSIKTCVK